jgi:hypothetical protein
MAQGKQKVISDKALRSASKFLRRVYVGKMEEQELFETLIEIDKEILRRVREKADEARKHRPVR